MFVLGLVFVVAAFDPEEPQAAKRSRATGSVNNDARRRNLDDRRQVASLETRIDITTSCHAHRRYLRASHLTTAIKAIQFTR
jgi:hypothetical protein